MDQRSADRGSPICEHIWCSSHWVSIGTMRDILDRIKEWGEEKSDKYLGALSVGIEYIAHSLTHPFQ